MLPLKDDLVSRSAPVMTVSIVTLNVLVFLYQTSLQLGISLEVDNPPHAARDGAGLRPRVRSRPVPARWVFAPFPKTSRAPLFTLFSSMFLHAGFLHVGGQYALPVDLREECRGHASAIPALPSFTCSPASRRPHPGLGRSPASEVPMIGASGAVSGVLGAYLILFPQPACSPSSSSGSSGGSSAFPAVLCWGSGSCSRS